MPKDSHKNSEPGDSNPTIRDYLQNIDYFPEFCKNYLKIMPIRGGLIPFELNPIQLYIFEHYIKPDYKAGKPVRICCMKMRQSGISTMIQALGLWYTIGRKHANSVLIAHTDNIASTIFRILKRYRDNIPDKKQCNAENIPVFPYFPIYRDSQGILEFNEPKGFRRKIEKDKKGNVIKGIVLDSRIEVKSAYEKAALGRGGTYQFVHASEAAYWPDLFGSLGSLLSACHEVPETIVFLETTANGYNLFYDFWTNLQIGHISVPELWQKLFIPWYWDHRYETDYIGEYEFDDDYEQALFDRIHNDEILRRHIDPELTAKRVWNKLAWRRMSLHGKFRGDIDHFKQEFPATENEAFRFSGITVWPTTQLTRLEKLVKPPQWQGHIDLVHKAKSPKPHETPTVVSLEEHSRGRLKIFKHPERFEKYVIGADVAEGKAIEGISEEKSKRDFSCAQVLRVTGYPPLEQVAVWHGNIDLDLYGKILVALAKHFNNSFLVWETRGPGRSLNKDIIRHCKYKYYYRRRNTESMIDRKSYTPLCGD